MVDKIKFNRAGLAEVLRSAEMQHMVQGAVDKLADEVRQQGITVGALESGGDDIPLPVTATVTITDRAHGRVTLAHPAGIAVQAKHGALTRAASAEGLSVRG